MLWTARDSTTEIDFSCQAFFFTICRTRLPLSDEAMELHQIRYFLAVAATLNFTRAAEECHVTQPALSRAIQKLEEELGGALLHRERGRTHLTELGRGMLPLLRQTYDSATAAKELAASYDTASIAPLRIGLSLTVHLDVIAPMLVELALALPGLELHVRRAAASDVMEALAAGEIELGIAAETGHQWDRLDRWPLFEEGFILLAPPGTVRSLAAPEALEGVAAIVRPYCETIAALPTASLTGTGARSGHAVTCDEDAARLVHCGMGVALVPESSRRLLPEAAVALDGSVPSRTVCVYGVAGRRRSTAAGALLKLLRAADWPALLRV
jgi:DNA-binding transcriptional LysR family regulator